jgi:hypothetical protein
MTSKREQIMEHLKARFEEMEDGVDDYTTTWNVVTRNPISTTEAQLGNVVGIFDVDEVKYPDMQFMRCNLAVVVEFYHKVQMGDKQGTELNRMLLDVQRAMRSDIYCSGLTLNVVEMKSELDIDGPADSLVAGVVEFQVQYRHYIDNPAL